jgi:hypothetical protein
MSGDVSPTAGSDPQARRRLIANERVKITATMLNNAAVAAFIASVVAPAVAAGYGITVPQSPYWWEFGIIWLTMAAAFHVVARLVLGDLKP